MPKLAHVYLYVLIDPITGDIRYVGKTIMPAVRLSLHISHTKKNVHKNNWLKQLQAVGKKPIMEIIEEMPDCDNVAWRARETYWIAYYKKLGSPLTNLDSGGRGENGRSEETKRKIGLKSAGRKHTPEALEKIKAYQSTRSPEINKKISATKTGKKMDPEVAKRAALARTGLKRSDEFKERQRLAGLNRRHSPETIAKMKALHGSRDPAINAKISATKTGVKDSPETREKKRLMRIGKKHSPETIQRMRDAAARRKALTASLVSAEPAI
jgi:hypothetical protein